MGFFFIMNHVYFPVPLKTRVINVDKRKALNIEADRLRRGPHGGPYKSRDRSKHPWWSEPKNSQLRAGHGG